MTPFEQHIDDCIASEVGLAQALQRDGFGDYTVPWVASKHKAWRAGREAALLDAMNATRAFGKTGAVISKVIGVLK